MFSDRWTLPLSMPTSNSATAFLSTSRAGFAKFDLGAEHASKRITICEVLGQISRRSKARTTTESSLELAKLVRKNWMFGGQA